MSDGLLAELYGDFFAQNLPANNHSNGYESARVALAGAGYLLSVTIYNSNAAAQFVQLHDAASVPANGAAPAVVASVGAASSAQLFWQPPGRLFLRGIVICNSSTGPTLTAGAADCFFDVQTL